MAGEAAAEEVAGPVAVLAALAAMEQIVALKAGAVTLEGVSTSTARGLAWFGRVALVCATTRRRSSMACVWWSDGGCSWYQQYV